MSLSNQFEVIKHSHLLKTYKMYLKTISMQSSSRQLNDYSLDRSLDEIDKFYKL